MRTARRTAATLVAALAAAACTPRRPPADLSLDPGALLAQVEAAGAAVTRVQGEARLRVDAPGARGVVMTAFVAAERPARLHVEALDFFGNPAATLVTADGRLAIYDSRARVFYEGAATAANVARLVPLPLSPERLVAILCGTPLLAGEPVSAEAGRGFVSLELRDGPRTASLRVGPGAALVRGSFRGAAPAVPDHDVVYSEHTELGGGRFPANVVISARDPAVRLEVGWKDPEVGRPLDPALFRMKAPAGARVVDLDVVAEPPQVPLPGALAPGE